MRNIIDYIEEPRFMSLMLELSKSNGEEDVNEIIRRYPFRLPILPNIILGNPSRG